MPAPTSHAKGKVPARGSPVEGCVLPEGRQHLGPQCSGELLGELARFVENRIVQDHNAGRAILQVPDETDRGGDQEDQAQGNDCPDPQFAVP